MLYKSSFGMALAGLIVLSGSAFADEFFYFTNAGNNVAWKGFYVNPYTAVDKSKVNGPDLTIYCDDWNTDFSGNPYWYASVTALTDVKANQDGLLGNLKYGKTTQNWNVDLNLAGTALSKIGPTGNPPPLDRYLEAAWLDNQWRTHAYGTSSTTQIELAAASWLLFADDTYNHLGALISDINDSGYAAEVSSYLTQAQQAVHGGWDASGWSVITPDISVFKDAPGPVGSRLSQTIDGKNMQEFLVYSTPEPGAVILLGTVLGILALAKLRRKVQA